MTRYENGKQVVEIDNTDYFYMLDNQIRPAMQAAEGGVFLPIAKRVLANAGVELTDLKDYPVEGYYWENDNLRLYLKILRNLQHNSDVYEKVKDSEELRFLQKVCNNDLWGIEDPHGRENKSPLKRRYDILTITMEDTSAFPDHDKTPRPWTIAKIMAGLKKNYANRTNLVELAYLTNDPKCLCCGAETNILYRMFACVSGSYCCQAMLEPTYEWKVSPEVEDLGRRIVTAYNEMLQNEIIVAPSLENHLKFTKTPKLPRVAMLGYVTETDEYYHWILTNYGDLEELYSKNIITTESYVKSINEGQWGQYKGATKYTGNIFNAVPIK
jgi:hypothetical protein